MHRSIHCSHSVNKGQVLQTKRLGSTFQLLLQKSSLEICSTFSSSPVFCAGVQTLQLSLNNKADSQWHEKKKCKNENTPSPLEVWRHLLLTEQQVSMCTHAHAQEAANEVLGHSGVICFEQTLTEHIRVMHKNMPAAFKPTHGWFCAAKPLRHDKNLCRTN